MHVLLNRVIYIVASVILLSHIKKLCSLTCSYINLHIVRRAVAAHLHKIKLKF